MNYENFYNENEFTRIKRNTVQDNKKNSEMNNIDTNVIEMNEINMNNMNNTNTNHAETTHAETTHAETNHAETTHAETNCVNMNNVDHWRLQSLYTDTKHVCAEKNDQVLTCDKLFAQRYRTQSQSQSHPSSLPVIVKDTSRPYTYYTMKSYGPAQDNNYYVNFDDHVSGNYATPCSYSDANTNNINNRFENENGTKVSLDDSGCEKTYLCSILGCFTCCLFKYII
jgi:hypothetical protein